MKGWIIVLLLLSLLSGYTASLADDRKQSSKNYLRWEPVEGAVSYAVNIKNSDGEIILDIKVKAAEYYFSLEPGKYQVRIGAVNRFERVVSWSDWSSLVIRPPVQPVITSVEPFKLPPSSKSELTIRGRDFISGARVFLQRDSRMISPETCRVVDKTLVSCTIKIPPGTEGDCSLVMANPGGLRATWDLSIERKRLDAEIPPGRIYFDAGYQFIHVLDDWQAPLENGVIGAELCSGMTLDVIPFFRKIAFMDKLALELAFSYAMFNSKERPGIVKSTLHQFIPGLYLAISLPLPVSGFFVDFRGGSGFAWHFLVRDWTLNNAETSSTIDLMLGTGAGLRYQWANISLQIGVDYHLIFTGVKNFHSLAYRAGTGIRF